MKGHQNDKESFWNCKDGCCKVWNCSVWNTSLETYVEKGRKESKQQLAETNTVSYFHLTDARALWCANSFVYILPSFSVGDGLGNFCLFFSSVSRAFFAYLILITGKFLFRSDSIAFFRIVRVNHYVLLLLPIVYSVCFDIFSTGLDKVLHRFSCKFSVHLSMSL